MKKLILVGAGGHSKSILASLSSEYCFQGYIDENKVGTYFSKPIFGNRLDDIPDFKNHYYFISIGDNGFRKLWFERINELGLNLINVIDTTAYVSPTATLGIGNFIGKFAILNTDSRIGDNNIINTHAIVEHECIIGNHVHLSTGAVINGNVIIEDSVFLGSMSVCIGNLCVGEGTTIGAGSVVLKNVESDVTAVGVPAFVIKRHGERI